MVSKKNNFRKRKLTFAFQEIAIIIIFGCVVHIIYYET